MNPLNISRTLKLLAGCAVLVTLSSCDYYAYKAPLCEASNQKDATSFSGAYQVSFSLSDEGQSHDFPPAPGTLTGTSSGALTLAMKDVEDRNSLHFHVCQVGPKLIFEEHEDEPEAPSAYVAFELSQTQTGYDLVPYGFDPALVQSKMPVDKEDTGGTHEIPVQSTAYTADNSNVSAETFVKFLKTTDSYRIRLQR